MPYLESTGDSLRRKALVSQICNHLSSSTCISQHLLRPRLVRILKGIKHQRKDRKELSVEHEPVRSAEHALFPDLKTNVNNVAGHADGRCRAGIREFINPAALAQSGRDIV